MLNIVKYSMMCYAVTVVISFVVMGIIVGFSKMLGSDNGADSETDAPNE